MLRDVEQIAAEFEADRQPYGVFVDNNLGSKPEYLRRLCRALKPLNKIWSAAVSIDVTDNPGLIREMAIAGCTGVFIGFESLQADNIVDSRKKSPRPDDYARRVAILHDNGIQVNGSFVLGFDHVHRTRTEGPEPRLFPQTTVRRMLQTRRARRRLRAAIRSRTTRRRGRLRPSVPTAAA